MQRFVVPVVLLLGVLLAGCFGSNPFTPDEYAVPVEEPPKEPELFAAGSSTITAAARTPVVWASEETAPYWSGLIPTDTIGFDPYSAVALLFRLEWTPSLTTNEMEFVLIHSEQAPVLPLSHTPLRDPIIAEAGTSPLEALVPMATMHEAGQTSFGLRPTGPIGVAIDQSYDFRLYYWYNETALAR